jgi:hypothetical protein
MQCNKVRYTLLHHQSPTALFFYDAINAKLQTSTSGFSLMFSGRIPQPSTPQFSTVVDGWTAFSKGLEEKILL